MRYFKQILCGLAAAFGLVATPRPVRADDNTTISSPTDEAFNPQSSRPTDFPSTLKVTSLEDMPYSGFVEKNGTYVGTGYAFYLLNLMRKKFNFTYTIVPPKANALGDKETGILSQLYKNEVDMVVAFIPVFPEMLQYSSFSLVLDEVVMTVLMKRPQESATGSGLLAPFDNTVWYLVLTSVVVVGPVIYIFVLIRSKLLECAEVERYSLLTCVWFVYGALLKQGSNVVATSDSTRLLFATWWIFIMILTSFYTANLTAFLTRPQFTLPIKSLEDIVKQGYRWAAFGGRGIEFLLSQKSETEVSALQKIKHRGQYIWDFKNPEKEILDIVNHGAVFLGETHFLQGLLLQDYLNKTARNVEHAHRCTYVIMPGSVYMHGHAFAFPLNSTIKKYINDELIKIVHAGLIKHFKIVDVPIAETCPVDLRSTERRLRNTDLLLTYIVIAFGFGLASLVFVYELLTKYLKSRKSRSRGHFAQNSCCSPFTKKSTNKYPSVGSVQPFYGKAFAPQSVLKGTPRKFVSGVETNSTMGKMHFINGRDYYIVIEKNGERRLRPVRTPSALLFHYPP